MSLSEIAFLLVKSIVLIELIPKMKKKQTGKFLVFEIQAFEDNFLGKKVKIFLLGFFGKKGEFLYANGSPESKSAFRFEISRLVR